MAEAIGRRTETVRYAKLMPLGPAAIGTVCLLGAGAARWLRARCRPLAASATAFMPNRPYVVDLPIGPAGACERAVVCAISETVLEIHCHGGAVMEAVAAWLDGEGCRHVAPEVACGAGEPPTIRAARGYLARARTERTAAVLLDQWRGALHEALRRVRAAIGRGAPDAARSALETILASRRAGYHLVEPFRVVLLGPANSGKSTLVNRWVGFERSLVDRSPGTTRDPIEWETALDGWPVVLIDTAGWREDATPVEQTGIARAAQAGATADLCVLVVDGHTHRPDIQRWLDQTRTALGEDRTLVVYTKSDLPSDPRWNAPGLTVSAHAGTGLARLAGAVVDRLIPAAPEAGSAVLFEPAWEGDLREAMSALERGTPQRALAHLSPLVGPTDPPEAAATR